MCYSTKTDADQAREILKSLFALDWKKAATKIEGYHLHIYHDAQTLLNANKVSRTLEILFRDDIAQFSRVIGAVGPHTAPNVAVYIRPEGFGRIVQWLQMNSEGLSILIHPETGDDLKDHLEGSMWLGKQVSYNQTFFDTLRLKAKMQP